MRRIHFPTYATLALLIAMAAMVLVQLPANAFAQTMPFPPTRVVNVSVNFNTQLPLPDLSEQTLAETQKSGRLSLYRLARDECDVMKTVIAESCRLTNINVTTQIQNYNNGQPVMLYVNGNANFTISLKAESAE
jgi:hypothetical protein